MTFQLPSEATGTAAGVLFYSLLGLVLNALVVWLTWVHQERTSYVALIAYIMLASTASCVASELHFFISWRDIMTAQWEAATASPKNPEMIISNGAVGADLGLWYFRQYTYSAASMLVFFWAFALLQSVYGWAAKPHLKVMLGHINAAGKSISILLPILTICLLQVKMIQKSLGVFMFLANVILMLSLAGGIVLMVAILARYIQSRRQLLSWSIEYDIKSTSKGSVIGRNASSFAPPPQHRGTYDRWLMTRFTIAFVVMGIFELTNMLFQFTGMSNSNKDAQSPSPDFSIDRAKETTILFCPGPAPSYLVFIVFGTTRPFRQYMYTAFVPKRWQRIPDPPPNQGELLSPKASTLSTLRSASLTVSSPISGPKSPTVDIHMHDLERVRIKNSNKTDDDQWPALPAVRPSYYKISK